VSQLPTDVKVSELAAHFSKCGILQLDPLSGNPKVKILDGSTAAVVFLMQPSVNLAITILDDAPLREGGAPLTVAALDDEKVLAELQLEMNPANQGEYDRVLKMRKIQQAQALSWSDNNCGGGLKIVVLKNLFDPRDSDVQKDPNFKDEFALDIREECEKMGEIKKVTVFEKHDEGIVVIKFRLSTSADKCIEVMNGRYFDGRVVKADYWDGKADYRPSRDLKALDGKEAEEIARLDSFADFLEKDAD